jgi:putative transposase
MTVFFEHRDYEDYLAILSQETKRWGVDLWAYCLMPNHVHLILNPPTKKSLSRAVGETHRRYALRTNRSRQWTGHLWQERFRSCAMDPSHTYHAARYVLQNPVRARLATHPAEWPYSSAAVHLGQRADPLVSLEPLQEYVDDWESYLVGASPDETNALLRRHSRSGRPLLAEFMEKRGRRSQPDPACEK